MSKEAILSILKELKPHYAKEGIEILGLFGSVAREDEDVFSDIDIVYHLNYPKFHEQYHDGFSKLLRLESVAKELEKRFHKPVDFIPDTNKEIVQKVEYV